MAQHDGFDGLRSDLPSAPGHESRPRGGSLPAEHEQVYPKILGLDGVSTAMGVAAATLINARARP